MKKTYIIPTTFCVELNTVSIMAISEVSLSKVDEGTGNVRMGSSSDYIEVKGAGDKSLWDNEW